MSLPLLDNQRQIELIRQGAYSQPKKIPLPTSVRVRQQTQPQTQPHQEPQGPDEPQGGGYDPKNLTSYPVYRGARTALNEIEAFFGGGIEAVDSTISDPTLRAAGHFGIGVVEFIPTAFMSSALVIPASEYIMREPGTAARNFIPAQGAMLGQMQQSAADDPARFAGGVFGMALGTKVYTKFAGGLKKASPYYERGMRVYTGRPNVAEVITGKQRITDYHYTLEGKPENVFNPGLTSEKHRYYHGTSRDFMGNIAASGTRGTTINPGGVHASGVSGLESALYFGAPETGYAHFVPNSKGAFIKLDTTVYGLSESTQALIGTHGPGRTLGGALRKEYYSAPKGELIPGVKPGMGIEYAGWTEWEYLLKPGTKLYPAENFRTKIYNAVGLERGTSFTVDPTTGKTIEILEVTTKKPKSSRYTGNKQEKPGFTDRNAFEEVVKSERGIPRREPRTGERGRIPRRTPDTTNLFRVFPEERRTRGEPTREEPRREARGDPRRDPPRGDPWREARGDPRRDPPRGDPWRAARGDPRRGEGRGYNRRTPTRPPTPRNPGGRPPVITPFKQSTIPNLRKKREKNGKKRENMSGNWGSFSYMETLRNMPVNKFLGF